jgi:hypothetical protein
MFMIFDRTTLFSDAQAVTVTAASTNIIDLGAVGTPMYSTQPLVRDVGKGKGVPLLIQVVDAFAAAGAATLQVQLRVDADPAMPSPKIVWNSPIVALSDLKPGYQFNIDYLPKGLDERYAQINYIVATGPMTSGKVTSGVTMGNQTDA